MNKRIVIVAAAIAAGLAGLTVGAVKLVGRSAEEAAPTTTTTTTAPVTTTTTVATTTSSTTTTTTTTLPGPTITLTLPGTGELQEAAEAFYAWLGDREGAEAPPVAEGLAAFLEDAAVEREQELTGDFVTGDLADGKRVAVVTAADDVLLAADEGQGWTIVGARLASLGLDPWYGAPVRYVMVIGTDARPGYIERVFRADSIHLLTSNIAEQAGAIVGFPRDSYVDTPYGRKDKLSSVNARADTEALVDIVRDLSGLPVEGYLITGFQSFRRMVDAFGGVTVNVPFAMADHHSSAYLSPGVQILWGQNALAFSRNRHLNGGDFTRSFHQGVVILGALDSVLGGDLAALPGLLELLLQYTWTDLSAGDLLTLAAGAYEMDPANVPNIVLPGTVQTISGASVVVLDPEVEDIYRDLDDGILTPAEG